MRYQAVAVILASCLAAMGCAVESGSDTESGDVAASADELAAAGKLLVGSYTATKVGFEQYEKLDLAANGTYEARVEAGPLEIVCKRAPCTVAESGTWTASKRSGDIFLTLKQAGSRTGVTYKVLIASDGGPMMLINKKTGESKGELHHDKVPSNPTFTCVVANACQFVAKGDLGFCVETVTVKQTAKDKATITLQKSAPNARFRPVSFSAEDYALTQTSFTGFGVTATWDEDSFISFETTKNGGALAGSVTIAEDFAFDVTCE